MRILFGLLFVLLLVSVNAVSQTMAYRQFEKPDQFGSDISWTLYKDNRGFIWAGPTGMGAVAFDGKRYIRFTDKDGLAGNFVISFLHDSHDNMWFGCQGQGISIYDGKKFTNFAEKDSVGLTTDNVLSFIETADGTIYLGTFGGGLLKFDGVRFSEVDTTKRSMSVYDMVEDRQGVLWLATRDSGIGRVDNGNITFVSDQIGLPKKIVLDLELTKDNELLICSSKGLYHYPIGSKAVRDSTSGLPSRYEVLCCTKTPDGKIYMGTVDGAYCISGNQVRLINDHGNIRHPFTKMLQDNAGNIWVSTNGNGIVQLIPNGFEMLSTPDNFLHVVTEDTEGNIYAANNFGIYRFHNNDFHAVDKRVNFLEHYGDVQWLIARDSAHFVFALKDQGLCQSYGGPDELEWFTGYESYDAVWTAENTLLLACVGNLLEYNFDKKTGREVSPLGKDGLFFSLCKDQNDAVWTSTYDEARIFKITKTDTLIYDDEHGLPKGAIICLNEDIKGRIWFLNIDGYYGYFNGTGFTVFPPFANAEVSTFIPDAHGDIWFSGRFGIARADFEADRLVSTHIFGESAGVSLELTPGSRAIRLKDGRILIPKADNKAYLFDPAEIRVVEETPVVYISSIRGRDGIILDSSRYSQTAGLFNIPQGLVLPYTENNLSVHAGAVYYTNPDSLLYTYQLVGYDDTWSNPKPQGEINFTNLPAGDYELLIKAQTSTGIESAVVSFVFSIETPWFQAWWFYLICVVTGGAVIWLIFRWRLSHIRKDKARLEAVVAERTREVILEKEIVEEKNKAILDSINYAKRLQNAILPSEEKLRKGLQDYFLFYQPKDIVSGDFYWFEERGDDLYLAVADCTGHGVPGAMVSTVCANALNKSLHERDKKSPSEILDSTRELVIDHFSKGSDAVNDGMDITLIRFNRKTRMLEFAGANNHLWIASTSQNSELIQLPADKQPVGKFAHAVPFTNVQYQLQTGDVLYLSSDGYQDQFGGDKGKKLKASNLKKLLFDMHLKTMNEQRQLLQTHFDEWRNDFEQVDDVCIMAVRV